MYAKDFSMVLICCNMAEISSPSMIGSHWESYEISVWFKKITKHVYKETVPYRSIHETNSIERPINNHDAIQIGL